MTVTLLILACMADGICRIHAIEVPPGRLCVLRQDEVAQWWQEHPDRDVLRWWCE